MDDPNGPDEVVDLELADKRCLYCEGRYYDGHHDPDKVYEYCPVLAERDGRDFARFLAWLILVTFVVAPTLFMCVVYLIATR